MDNKKHIHIFYAILAALLFGLNIPLSKILIQTIPPLMMAALLYLGAGLGMLIVDIGNRAFFSKTREARLSGSDLPFIILMVLLDIAAPILLMTGLLMTSAANAALLGNFEIAATAMIAMIIFKENTGKRLWAAIFLITLSSMILTFQDMGAFGLSLGSIFIILACVCWGFENNCTRKLSSKDPLQIVVIKGLGSGTGVFLIAVFFNSVVFFPAHILYALFLGFFAYGLSIYFYVKAQRHLGAARTGSYFALAPFIGVILSFLLLREPLTPAFFAALVIMIAGTWLVLSESHSHRHIHQMVQHDHRHNHSDGHHGHTHDKEVKTDHSHFHNHKPMAHDHDHTPDLHHRHQD